MPNLPRSLCLGLGLSIILCSVSIQAATHSVTTTSDSGPGSLRQAIIDANATAAQDSIQFDISGGPGVHTIAPSSSLPSITSPVTIDGYTQPGASPNTLTNGNNAVLRIELSGQNIPTADGLGLGTSNCLVRGLVINGWNNAIVIGGHSNVIAGNFVGTDPTGMIARTNAINGVFVVTASFNRIGGNNPADRNVIASSGDSGVYIHALPGVSNRVEGNYIGVNAAGTAALGNASYGVRVNWSSGTSIGGVTPGSGNLISGNLYGAIGIWYDSAQTTIEGNLIGTDPTGTLPIPNRSGIGLQNNIGSRIGGTVPGSRNIISGNLGSAISLGPHSVSNVIQGNLIGVNATGSASLANENHGIQIYQAADNLIGGDAAHAGNVISGNGLTAISLVEAHRNKVQGNLVGTDASSTIAVPNGTRSNHPAVQILGGSGNLIGGTSPSERNIISGNFEHGIAIQTPGATNNRVVGNFIGTDISGLLPIGNGLNGVHIDDAPGNFIGGLLPGEGNSIAHNGRTGVAVVGNASTNNIIAGNSIQSNNGLGLNLADDGATANDTGDLDAGPNWSQNFPIITLASSSGGSLNLQGLLNSQASTLYRLDFYANEQRHASGYGEGALYIGATSVTTDSGGNASFNVSFPAPPQEFRHFTATATDPAGNTSEFSPNTAGGLPVVTVTPASTNVTMGSSVTFCAQLDGPGPYSLQWRKNAVNLPGEINPCITITNVQLADGAAYTVIVANDYGAILSTPVQLILDLPPVQGGDARADRTGIGGVGGLLMGTNDLATSDPDEPRHFDKPGGKSVWYSWVAPGTGIATFRTTGSRFDTLLAIYVECSPSNLVEIASDDDRGTNLTSFVRFNALAGTNYLIALDGFDGAEGGFALSWLFEETGVLLPVILSHPESVTAAPGGGVNFSVEAIPGCLDGHHGCGGDHGTCTNDWESLNYQWLFNGTPIAGAVNQSYALTAAETNVGNYSVWVTRSGRTIESRVASLQMNLTGGERQDVLAHEKFADAAALGGIELGGFRLPEGPPGLAAAPSTVVRGYTGTHVFNTAGASTEPGDQLICGVIGGASKWITFVPLDSGVLHIGTDGSSYDTVMAVFVRAPANPAVLQLLDCDDNGGQDGRDSALNVPVQAGVTNFIMIDGVNGATGTLRLKYSLVTSAKMIALGPDTLGPRMRILGHPEMRFTVEISENTSSWSSLLTTNADVTFDFTDNTAAGRSQRFYRALMLP